MAEVVYALGICSTLLCAVLLLRQYSALRQRLLLWSGLCFIGLTLNNAVLFTDMILIPSVDLRIVRLSIGATSLSLLVFGLIWESKGS